VPELPEVETMVRGIRPHIEAREITAARRCRCSCKPMLIEPAVRSISRRVVGSVISKVHRIGKRVVLELSTGDSFVIEPRMTGITLLSDPPDRGHLRFEWQLAGDGEYQSLWFWDRRGLGTIRLLSKDEMLEKLGPTKLGPDALTINEAEWREQCARTGRAIKPALLDQKLVAGIGNLYASEILHAARIHPECPADRLKPRQIRRLADAVRHVLTEAIRAEGSTLGDGTYRNALNQDGGYQNQHRVYARDGERCPTCGKTHILRIVQNQRSTFFCPACQRK
jgi:formamidopyrimidine-DNA glycosylase